MKGELITDSILRSRWGYKEDCPVYLEEDDILTPLAKEFIKEHKITIVRSSKRGSMTRTQVPKRDGRPVFVELSTGKEMTEKPEELTHLRGNILIAKTDKRIEFRGKLDSLLAEILLTENYLYKNKELSILKDLEEIYMLITYILAAEVKDEALPPQRIMGMDYDEIRKASHDIKGSLGIDHPIPSYTMDEGALRLNALRTKVREAELSAAAAFDDHGICTRKDLILALNRLSSSIYILFCRKIAGYYNRR